MAARRFTLMTVGDAADRHVAVGDLRRKLHIVAEIQEQQHEPHAEHRHEDPGPERGH